jgi:hypothetical protein
MPVSSYAVSFVAMMFSAASALTIFYALRHLEIPHNKQ